MKLIIQASTAVPSLPAPRCRLASTSVPARRRDSRVAACLTLLFSMACLTATVTAEAATVWSGPKVIFTKADGANPTQAADSLTSNVSLTRGSTQGLFNIARETSFARFQNVSPADTEWASGTTANYASLTYTNWQTWAGSRPPETVGVNAVLHLKTDDIYLDIKFLSWSQRSGGFSYERSTPGASTGNADCLFNWAESNYPELFAPPATSETDAPYYYRFYSQTKAYLGTSSVDNHVYYLGPLFNNVVHDVDALSTLLVTAGCQ